VPFVSGTLRLGITLSSTNMSLRSNASHTSSSSGSSSGSSSSSVNTHRPLPNSAARETIPIIPTSQDTTNPFTSTSNFESASSPPTATIMYQHNPLSTAHDITPPVPAAEVGSRLSTASKTSRREETAWESRWCGTSEVDGRKMY